MNRLTNRIARLERQASPGESADADGMLVELLAKRDALFWPWRDSQKGAALYRGAVRKRQVEYLQGALGFAAPATGKDSWKDAYQQRGQLIAGGLATAIRSGGEITALRLTPQGEADARALVGPRLKTLADGDVQAIYAYNVARMEDGNPWLGCLHPDRSGAFVSETAAFLSDTELTGNPSQWDYLTELMLPLLVAGYMMANNDLQGRVYYAVVPKPQAKPEPLVTVAELPQPPASERVAVARFDDLYVDTFNAERDALTKLESFDLVIPVPATCFHKFRESAANV